MTEARLPNRDRALVPEPKVVGYLLNDSHPDGRGKAQFFSGHGFSIAAWQRLADALRTHATAHPVVEAVPTAFGVRYVIEGTLQTPDGRSPVVRVVWFVERDGSDPVLVTAYPLKRR